MFCDRRLPRSRIGAHLADLLGLRLPRQLEGGPGAHPAGGDLRGRRRSSQRSDAATPHARHPWAGGAPQAL